MVTTQSGRRTINQQELSGLFSNISFLNSSQGQPQEIMSAPVDGLQDPYLDTLYNKAISGLPESNRCDLTRSKWKDFYQ